MVKIFAGVGFVALVGGAGALVNSGPSIAAGGLLHPVRQAVTRVRPASCVDRSFDGAEVTLRGWSCAAPVARRGTIVYLHGVADNRGSGAGTIERYTARGFDVIAFDGRAHGESTGEACTYGFHEKRDLARVLDTVAQGPIVLIGTSLGAAVALQAAAEDPRISGVVAAEVFADLESVARERVPFLPEWMIRDAFALAEERGRFRLADVSPEAAARRIRVPVLLIHGAADVATRPHHSHRVFAALAEPKRLLLVDGAGHNQSLHRFETWREVDAWIESVIAGGKS